MKYRITRTNGRMSVRNGDSYQLLVPYHDASLSRSGQDLVMDFGDRGRLVFEDYYRNPKTSFIIDDQEIGAREFFAQLGAESLAPAMGPAQPSAQSDSDHSSHHSWDTMSALQGIDHLGVLDYSQELSREPQEVRRDNYDEPGRVNHLPEAGPDSGSLFEGDTIPATGNVMNFSSGGLDGFSRVEWPDAENGVIRGLHGVLTVDAGGGWSYLLNNDDPAVMGLGEGQTLEESFDFSVFDMDGDRASSRVTITISGISGTPEIGSGSVVLREENLPGGSDPDAAAIIRSGRIDVTSPDGVAGLFVNGTGIPVAGGGITIEIDGVSATFKYDPASVRHGILTFSAKLTGTVDHGASDSLFSGFDLRLVDYEGKSVSGRVDVGIIDDHPEAADDRAALDHGGESVSGDVSANDAYNADGAGRIAWENESGGRIDLEYGWLEADASGRWTYHPDYGNPAVAHLKPGEELVDKAPYDILDADGDRASATLTITISGIDHGVELSADSDPEKIHEHELLDGNPVRSGAIEISAADGIGKIIIDGHELPEDGALAIETGRGRLAVWLESENGRDGILKYSYELTGAGPHAADNDEIRETFGLEVFDQDGSSRTGSIIVDIIDDVPALSVNGGGALLGGESLSGGWAHSFGADDGLFTDGRIYAAKGDPTLKSFTVNGEELDPAASPVAAGKYGDLTLNPDGTWEYRSHPLAPGADGGIDEFSFLIVDADGDMAGAILSFTVSRPVFPGISMSDPANEAEIGSPVALDIPEGWTVSEVVSDGRHGHFARTDSGWAYILGEAIDSGNETGRNMVAAGDEGTLRVADSLGNEWIVRVPVSIIDDIPELLASQDAETLMGGETLSGSWRHSFGADTGELTDGEAYGEGWPTLKSFTVNGEELDPAAGPVAAGKYGDLTLNPDGTWEYAARPVPPDGGTGTDVFILKTVDADGDEAEALLSFAVGKPAFPGLSLSDPANEAEIGSPVDLVVPEGWTIVEMTRDGEHGNFVKNADGSWAYILGEPIDSGAAPGRNRVENGDSGHFRVTDGLGNEWIVKAPVSIIDDIPVLSGGEGSLYDGQMLHGVFSEYSMGADAAGSRILVNGEAGTEAEDGTLVFRLPEGELAVRPDGSWSVSLDESHEGTPVRSSFTLKMIDTDGDAAERTVDYANIPPTIDAISPIVADEGKQGHLDGTGHPGEGGDSFIIHLNSESGIIRFGDHETRIVDGAIVEGGEIPDFMVKDGETDIMSVSGATLTHVSGNDWKLSYDWRAENPLDHREVSGGCVPVQVVTPAGSDSGSLSVDIHDDMSIPDPGDVKSWIGTDTVIFCDFTQNPYANSTSDRSDFEAAGWEFRGEGTSDIFAGYKGANQIIIGILNDIEFIATTNNFRFTEGGVIDRVWDTHHKPEDMGNATLNTGGKSLNISEEGLGVGRAGYKNYNGNLIGCPKGGEYGLPAGALRSDVDYYGEAVSIEPRTGDIYYGMSITLTGMARGARAIITFMLTPQQNNDDSVVLIYDASTSAATSYDPATGTATFHIDVPAGYTKAQVAAAPQPNGARSTFLIQNLGIDRKTYEFSGRVDIREGADDPSHLEFAFDPATVDGREISIIEAIGMGRYSLRSEVSADGKDITLFLEGDEGQALTGRIFMKGRFDAETGEWHTVQYYRATDEYPFTIGVHAIDADGSDVAKTLTISLAHDDSLNRFDDISAGYYDGAWDGSNNKADGYYDNASDILEGKSGNDLIYGRGGSDVIMSDGGMDALLDYLVKNDAAFAEWAGNFPDGIEWRELTAEDNVGRDQRGPNHELVSRIRDAIEAHRDDQIWLANLSQLIDRLPGGDDAVFGGVGDDILFAGAGNDVIQTTGKIINASHTDGNITFAGAGHDIIAYSGSDSVIHGGAGVDFLIAGRSQTASLRELLDNSEENGQRIYDVEIMLKSLHTDNYATLGINVAEDLLRYGLSFENGMLKIGDSWEKTGDGEFRYEKDGVILSLETIMTERADENGVRVYAPENLILLDGEIVTDSGGGALDLSGTGGDVTISGSFAISNMQSLDSLELLMNGEPLGTPEISGQRWSFTMSASDLARMRLAAESPSGDAGITLKAAGTNPDGQPVVTEIPLDLRINLVPEIDIRLEPINLTLTTALCNDPVTFSGRADVRNGQWDGELEVLANGETIETIVPRPDGTFFVNIPFKFIGADAEISVRAHMTGFEGAPADIVMSPAVTTDYEPRGAIEFAVGGDNMVDWSDIDAGTIRLEGLVRVDNGRWPDTVDILIDGEVFATVDVDIFSQPRPFAFGCDIPSALLAKGAQVAVRGEMAAKDGVLDEPFRMSHEIVMTPDLPIRAEIVFEVDDNIVNWEDIDNGEMILSGKVLVSRGEMPENVEIALAGEAIGTAMVNPDSGEFAMAVDAAAIRALGGGEFSVHAEVGAPDGKSLAISAAREVAIDLPPDASMGLSGYPESVTLANLDDPLPFRGSIDRGHGDLPETAAIRLISKDGAFRIELGDSAVMEDGSFELAGVSGRDILSQAHELNAKGDWLIRATAVVDGQEISVDSPYFLIDPEPAFSAHIESDPLTLASIGGTIHYAIDASPLNGQWSGESFGLYLFAGNGADEIRVTLDESIPYNETGRYEGDIDTEIILGRLMALDGFDPENPLAFRIGAGFSMDSPWGAENGSDPGFAMSAELQVNLDLPYSLNIEATEGESGWKASGTLDFGENGSLLPAGIIITAGEDELQAVLTDNGDGTASFSIQLPGYDGESAVTAKFSVNAEIADGWTKVITGEAQAEIRPAGTPGLDLVNPEEDIIPGLGDDGGDGSVQPDSADPVPSSHTDLELESIQSAMRDVENG